MTTVELCGITLSASRLEKDEIVEELKTIVMEMWKEIALEMTLPIERDS